MWFWSSGWTCRTHRSGLVCKVSSDKWIPKLTVSLLHQPFQGKRKEAKQLHEDWAIPLLLPCSAEQLLYLLWPGRCGVVHLMFIQLWCFSHIRTCSYCLPCAAVPHQLQAAWLCQRQPSLGTAGQLHMVQGKILTGTRRESYMVQGEILTWYRDPPMVQGEILPWYGEILTCYREILMV